VRLDLNNYDVENIIHLAKRELETAKVRTLMYDESLEHIVEVCLGHQEKKSEVNRWWNLRRWYP
jgi:hypothetical protein